MLKIIGGFVVYGFALYGLANYLLRTERRHDQSDPAEGRAS